MRDNNGPDPGRAPLGHNSLKRPVPFLDDWPDPPKCKHPADKEEPGLTDAKKWRLQILLACNPYGIPMSNLAETYEKMFGTELNAQEMGFVDIAAMVQNLTDIFAIQKPDELTAVLFPEQSYDIILHDSRLGHDFLKPRLDSQESSDGELDEDHNSLISQAWFERDEEFPPDVVLSGEQYQCIFPMSSAKLEGTRGLYEGTIVGVASPDSFFIRLSAFDREQIIRLSAEIGKYFMETERSIDAYSVPKEFLYTGFPCLSYVGKEKTWERCLIVGRAPNNKILVESVDFGGVYAVSRIHLYLIPQKFFELPRQTLRANLPGLKPSNKSRKWSKKVGSRMRCFSFDGYTLDILLMDSYEETIRAPTSNQSASGSGSLSSIPSSPDNELKGSQKKKPLSRGPQYDAIIVDRNDDEMDIYLDEILALETYAVVEESEKICKMKIIKDQLREVLKDLPRPENPFER